VVRIGTDWFVKVDCPNPDKGARNSEEHITACVDCPYLIWDEPQSVAGFMSSMCGVRVGSIWIAGELDEIAENLLGVERFTKLESSAALKIQILEQIRRHAEETNWHINGFTRAGTIAHMDTLMEFCRRAQEKGLKIWAWA
jgi:hypothetical protein